MTCWQIWKIGSVTTLVCPSQVAKIRSLLSCPVAKIVENSFNANPFPGPKKVESGKWVGHDYILGGENHPTTLPFRCQKMATRFFGVGFNSTTKVNSVHPPPQNPDKTQPRTKDYNLQRPQRQLPYPANFYLRTNAMWGEKNLDDAGGDLRTFKKEFKSPQRRNLLTFWIEGIYLLVAFWFPIGTYLFDWIWKLKKKTR